MNNIHTIIIPDIHGRTFWKDIMNMFPNDKYKNLNIIFLGDYLDPYTSLEGITANDALVNFKEIIDYSKNDNRIKLLIGNHDFHYIYRCDNCRIDYYNFNEIKDIFLKNFTLFNIAYEEIINNEKYLYTHAGVTSWWLQHLRLMGKIGLESKIGKISEEQKEFCKMLQNITPTADELNQMKDNFQGLANLAMISIERGGDNNCGSCIWADIYEHLYINENNQIDNINIWQIFGHSLYYPTLDEVYIDKEKKIAMLDGRHAWGIYDDGNFIKFS